MTDQQARALLQEIEKDTRITGELIRKRVQGKKCTSIKLFHKRLHRSLLIHNPEAWESVQEVWELVSEGCTHESEQGYRLAGGRLIQR